MSWRERKNTTLDFVLHEWVLSLKNFYNFSIFCFVLFRKQLKFVFQNFSPVEPMVAPYHHQLGMYNRERYCVILLQKKLFIFLKKNFQHIPKTDFHCPHPASFFFTTNYENCIFKFKICMNRFLFLWKIGIFDLVFIVVLLQSILFALSFCFSNSKFVAFVFNDFTCEYVYFL